jgi:hypothetical protein
VFARTFLDEVRLVVLNNAWDTAQVTVPVHANPRLPRFVRCLLPNGLELFNELDPNDRTRVVDGSVRVRLPGKTGAVYGGKRQTEDGAHEGSS